MENMTIVFSVNNNYVPYLSVILHSIYNHLNTFKQCEIIILHKDISHKNIFMLRNEFSTSSFHLNFIDMNPIIDGKDFYIGNRLSVETYFRLFLPWILTDRSKAIYLDCDMIVNHDIYELWNADLEGYLLAATRDCGIIGFCYNDNFDRREYTERVLKISNINNYLQAGVLLMNLNAFRKQFSLEQMRNIILNNKFRHHDQDILNIICDGQILFLEQRWDFVIENKRLKMLESIQMSPKWIQASYKDAKQNPYIIHYASEQKPWFYSECEYGDLYWKYVSLSSYHGEIIRRREEYLQDKQKLFSKMKDGIKLFINEKFLPIGSRRRKIVKGFFRK